jgi:hypothetical protein
MWYPRILISGDIYGVQNNSQFIKHTPLSLVICQPILFFSYYRDQNASPNIKFSSGCYSKTS